MSNNAQVVLVIFFMLSVLLNISKSRQIEAMLADENCSVTIYDRHNVPHEYNFGTKSYTKVKG
jgi:hypothetical protein